MLRDETIKNPHKNCRQSAGCLDPSGATVADGDLVALDDNGHLARTLGILQHLLKLCRVFVDIVILGIAVG
jgi:hypothetical protein